MDHQENIMNHSMVMENMMDCSKTNTSSTSQDQSIMKKPRPQPEQALKCPRCDSTNTKFCYYNNYSLSQPRYFCKSCRRYWTRGGTLRNVPVGGGCRKSKLRSSSSSSSSSKRSSPDEDHQSIIPNSLINSSHMITTHLPPLTNSSYDHDQLISVALARLQKQTNGCGGQMGNFDHHHHHDHNLSDINLGLNNCDDFLGNPNFLDAFRNGFVDQSFQVISDANADHLDHLLYNGMKIGEMLENSSGSEAISRNVEQGVKQEMFGGRENDENRILWGFPNWQLNLMNGDQGNDQVQGEYCYDHIGVRDQSWNNIGVNAAASSSWPHGHGLLNIPLM